MSRQLVSVTRRRALCGCLVASSLKTFPSKSTGAARLAHLRVLRSTVKNFPLTVPSMRTRATLAPSLTTSAAVKPREEPPCTYIANLNTAFREDTAYGHPDLCILHTSVLQQQISPQGPLDCSGVLVPSERQDCQREAVTHLRAGVRAPCQRPQGRHDKAALAGAVALGAIIVHVPACQHPGPLPLKTVVHSLSASCTNLEHSFLDARLGSSKTRNALYPGKLTNLPKKPCCGMTWMRTQE